MPTLVIAAYSCEVGGEPTDSIDYQVRYFTSDEVDAITARLRIEQPVSYENSDGEIVRWIFDGTVAVEVDPQFEDGREIIGFISGKSKEINK